MEKLTTETE